MLSTIRSSLVSGVAGGAVVLAGLVACGCGRRDMGQVEGRLTFRGQPVADAIINFLPVNQPQAAGKTDADGRFVLSTFAKADGAIGGPCRVVVMPFVDVRRDEGPNPPRPPDPAPRPDIPRAYRTASSSPLTVEVQTGRRNFFELAME